MQGRFFLENTRNKGEKHDAEEAKPETKDDADKKIPTSIHLVRRADYLCELMAHWPVYMIRVTEPVTLA
jgi:hypothetical protein